MNLYNFRDKQSSIYNKGIRVWVRGLQVSTEGERAKIRVFKYWQLFI